MEPTKAELLEAKAGTVDTDALRFDGMRGDSALHMSRAALEAGLAALSPAPRDTGHVDMLVARGARGERNLPGEVQLSVEGGMPGDRWFGDHRYGPDYQLATTRTDFARLIANGQPLELHGDNLFLSLDISVQNLPVGSELLLGSARVCVTPVAHNGCKKWVQRFGLQPMQLNLSPQYRDLHLRGIYLKVIEDGVVRVGDAVRVLSRSAG